MPNYGQANPSLTKAINRAVAHGTAQLVFSTHSEDQMDDRGFDHGEVLECLRRGVAYGPEIVKGEQRANVVHRGLNIRVVVAGVAKMQHLTVVTVMEAK